MVLVCWCAVPCFAPVGMSFSPAYGAASSADSGDADSMRGMLAAAASIGTAAAAGLVAMRLRRNSTPGGSSPSWQIGEGPQDRPAKSGAEPRPVFFGGIEDDEDDEDHDLESEAEDYDAECDASDEDEDNAGGNASTPRSVKLWSNAQFPEGVRGQGNYDLANLEAAQTWSCPCADRRNCIGAERLKLTALYEHRKEFMTTSTRKGGLRDANRTQLLNHYDRSTNKFTRSFVVGPLGDCCAASAGLANGISFATFANSRADVTKDRAWHAARCKQKDAQHSAERAHLESYIRSLRAGLEGPKGGSQQKDTWSIEASSMSQRWAAYTRSRVSVGKPVIGSESLFKSIWSEHKEIHVMTAKGHATCDECGSRAAARVPFENRTDAVAMDRKRELDRAQVRRSPSTYEADKYAQPSSLCFVSGGASGAASRRAWLRGRLVDGWRASAAPRNSLLDGCPDRDTVRSTRAEAHRKRCRQGAG